MCSGDLFIASLFLLLSRSHWFTQCREWTSSCGFQLIIALASCKSHNNCSLHKRCEETLWPQILATNYQPSLHRVTIHSQNAMLLTWYTPEVQTGHPSTQITGRQLAADQFHRKFVMDRKRLKRAIGSQEQSMVSKSSWKRSHEIFGRVARRPRWSDCGNWQMCVRSLEAQLVQVSRGPTAGLAF